MLLRSVLYSILVHAAVAGLLVLSFDFPVQTLQPPQPSADIVTAVTVDEEQVEAELQRLKEKEERKHRAEQKRQEELEQKLKQAERQRRAEEQRLAELKKQQQREEQQRRKEQQRLVEMKKQQQELQQERKLEEQRKREAEAERKRIEAEKERIEEEKRQAELEKQRIEEAKREAEEERKRREAEEALKKQLAEEQRALEEEQRRREAAQARADQKAINEYGRRIQDAIRRQFNITGLPEGLSCVLLIRTIPGGEVVGVKVAESSGNSIFDRRAETAVNKASPLPVPDNMRLFEKMREIRLTFAPEG